MCRYALWVCVGVYALHGLFEAIFGPWLVLSAQEADVEVAAAAEKAD